jgi:hypothetical protein
MPKVSINNIEVCIIDEWLRLNQSEHYELMTLLRLKMRRDSAKIQNSLVPSLETIIDALIINTEKRLELSRSKLSVLESRKADIEFQVESESQPLADSKV